MASELSPGGKYSSCLRDSFSVITFGLGPSGRLALYYQSDVYNLILRAETHVKDVKVAFIK